MKTAYVILGMHRSGTSSVAGTLATLGAQPPATLMEAKEENPRGFWESEKVMVLNDQIFQSVGSSWHDWGELNPAAFSGAQGEAFDAAARALIAAEFGEADVIVLKDPRLCRLYPFWRAALLACGYSPIVVSPIRAPHEVVASLVARNGVPPTLALRLWLSHVLAAEVASRDDPRHIMGWPDFIPAWRTHLQQIQALGGPALPIEARAAEVDAFLNADLHRHRMVGTAPDLPPLAARAAEAMGRLAQGHDVDAALRDLDAIREEFAAARQLFYDGPY